MTTPEPAFDDRALRAHLAVAQETLVQMRGEFAPMVVFEDMTGRVTTGIIPEVSARLPVAAGVAAMVGGALGSLGPLRTIWVVLDIYVRTMSLDRGVTMEEARRGAQDTMPRSGRLADDPEATEAIVVMEYDVATAHVSEGIHGYTRISDDPAQPTRFIFDAEPRVSTSGTQHGGAVVAALRRATGHVEGAQ